MKITEMTNDQAAEALIRLSVPFGNICEDKKMLGMIESYKEMSKQPFIQTIGKMLPEIIGYAFKSHKEDLYEIVGALTGKTTAQVARMNFLETIKTVKDSYDEVLSGFFTSSATRMKDTAEKSSAS